VTPAIAPNPIVDHQPPPIAPAKVVEDKPRSSGPILPIHTYARVKVSVWDRGLQLLEALDELNLDEPTWRDNELRMAEALAREAEDGRATLASAVRHAIRALRTDQEGSVDDMMPLQRYAEVRVALEAAQVIDEAPELALARLSLSPESWDTARTAWTKHARGNPAVARQVRRAVASARRNQKNKQLEAAEPVED
jgi:hypothetical protein